MKRKTRGEEASISRAQMKRREKKINIDDCGGGGGGNSIDDNDGWLI